VRDFIWGEPFCLSLRFEEMPAQISQDTMEAFKSRREGGKMARDLGLMWMTGDVHAAATTAYTKADNTH